MKEEIVFASVVELEAALEEFFPQKSKRVTDITQFDLGWISPLGKMYSLPYSDHAPAAEEICEEVYDIPYYRLRADIIPENYLQEKGWVKIFLNVYKGEKEFYPIMRRPTREQQQVIEVLIKESEIFNLY